MRVAVLNNLRAGQSRTQVAQILDLLRSHPDVLHVETNTSRAVPDAISDLARKNVDVLAVNGGDGSLQHVLNELLDRNRLGKIPIVAPLRGGRTNMTAADLGAHRNPVRGLERLLASVTAGTLADRLVQRPVLRLQSNHLRAPHYGMFMGVGMIHRAIGLTHRLFPGGRSQGAFGGGLVTAGLIAKSILRPTSGVLKPDKVRILLDGEAVPHGEFYLVIATVLERLFCRMNPFWGREPKPVRFTSIATIAPRKCRAATSILRGRRPEFATPEAGYTSRNADRIELALDSGYTIDGEIFPGQPDEIVSLSADTRVTFARA